MARIMKMLIAIFLFILLFITVAQVRGFIENRPKNYAVRKYPSAKAMARWTDFSGDYVVKRISDGRTLMHHKKSFMDETKISANDARVTIQQSGSTNMTLVYDRQYGASLATNVISIGKTTNPWSWVWDNGKAVYEEKYLGVGTFLPGIVSGRYTSIVSKNDDSSLTITSTYKSGGRLFWLMPWEDPVDCSIIKLMPVAQEQTNSMTDPARD